MITRRPHIPKAELQEAGIQYSELTKLKEWLRTYDGIIQLDTETNIIEGVFGWEGYLKGKNKSFQPYYNEDGKKIPMERQCYSIQIGSEDKRVQWFVDTVGFTFQDELDIVEILSCDNVKLIHNALFDYTVIKWVYGVTLTNMRCTYVMSSLITAGFEVGEDIPKGYHSYAGCVNRYVGIELSKEEQTGFNGEPNTLAQIIYGITDVIFLIEVYNAMLPEIAHWELENTFALENAILAPYGETMLVNMYLNTSEWRTLMAENKRDVIEITAAFKADIVKYFEQEAKDMGYIHTSNYMTVPWGSGAEKLGILKLVHPDISCKMRLGDLKKEVKIREGEDTTLLQHLSLKEFTLAEEYLLKNHRDFIISKGWYKQEGDMDINLNSPKQLLEIFHLIDSNLEGVGKESIKDISHPLASSLRKFNRASKLYTAYGQNFLDAVSPDGMFRVKGIKQILSTGRSSMSHLQLLPGLNKYRTPFTPNNPETGLGPDGHRWVTVAADYASQEAIIAATFGEEEDLLNAVKNGQDFHSTCAAMMFKEKWLELGGDPNPKGKPKVKELLILRGQSKSVSFGLFYGKTAIGLGDTLSIPAVTEDLITWYPEETEIFMLNNNEVYKRFLDERHKGRVSVSAYKNFLKIEHKEGRYMGSVKTADDLIDLFYATFPNIHSYLLGRAEFAVANKYVRTSGPVGRIRRFKFPESNTEENSIRRKAQNSPIQGAAADMTKLAIAKIWKYLLANDLTDKIRFSRYLHDELVIICRESVSEDTLKLLIRFMEEAAEVILENTVLKAEGGISDCWVK